MIPSKQSNLTNEDSKCAVCDDGEGENSNAIVFCDGCNLAVHQGEQALFIFPAEWLLIRLSRHRLLWCAVYPGRTMALSEMYSGTREPCSTSVGMSFNAATRTLRLHTLQDCIFCPNEGGAYKQTNRGAWAHLLCAIWIPEVGVSNSVYMEPIEGVETIPKSRWKLVSETSSHWNFLFNGC